MTEKSSFWSTLPGVLTAAGGIMTAAATLVGALYSAGIIGTRGRVEQQAPTPDSTPAASAPLPAQRSADLELRALPAILNGNDLKARLVRHGLFDRRMNPAGRGVGHDYESQVIGADVVVIDHATGLMWQQGGSDGPRAFADANAYIRELNLGRFGGFTDWRLPTAEEVGSLMDPEDHGGFHIGPVFQPGVNFVWSSDRNPDDCIWIAYFLDAQLACENPAFNAWVRAVRALEPSVYGGIR